MPVSSVASAVTLTMPLTCAPLAGKSIETCGDPAIGPPTGVCHVRLNLCLCEHAIVDAQVVKHSLVELRGRSIRPDPHGVATSRDRCRQRLRVDEGTVDIGPDLRAVEGDRKVSPLVVGQGRACAGDARSTRRPHIESRSCCRRPVPDRTGSRETTSFVFQNFPITTELPLASGCGLIHIDNVRALPEILVEAELGIVM